MSTTSTEIEECSIDEGETSNRPSGLIIGLRNEDSEVLFGMNFNNFPLHTIREEDCESSVFSVDIRDSVYVVVRYDDSSMEALSWALKHFVTSFTVVCLVHVFPVVKLIPSPMGEFPRTQVNSEYVSLYLTQEKAKRKLLLRSFIDLCDVSEVKVETICIEDDNVAQAIVKLVANRNITKLVMGITKSNISKCEFKRQNATAAQVLKNVQESCEVKIICKGKEVNEQVLGCASIRSTDSINNSIFLVVGDDNNSSMQALSYTLKHFVMSSTVVCLIHVYPVAKLIPSPLGKFPRAHVKPEYVNLHLTKEEDKRKLLLQSFIDLCIASEVKVDFILIESDNAAKAIVELVANLNISKLVIGTTKSNLSGKSSRRLNALANQVLKNAQHTCDVKIICDGKEVVDQGIGCASTSSGYSISSNSSHDQNEVKLGDLAPFMGFMPNPIKLFKSKFLSPK